MMQKKFFVALHQTQLNKLSDRTLPGGWNQYQQHQAQLLHITMVFTFFLSNFERSHKWIMAAALSDLSPLGAVTKHFSKIMCVSFDTEAVLGVIILKLASKLLVLLMWKKKYNLMRT